MGGGGGGPGIFGTQRGGVRGLGRPLRDQPAGYQDRPAAAGPGGGAGRGPLRRHGNLGWYTVSWEYQYQAIDDYGNAVSGWASLHAWAFDNHTMMTQRMTVPCPLAPGRYQLRGRRTPNSPGDGRTLDTLQWTAMRAMLPGTVTYPQSVVTVKIKATNAMSQAAAGKFKALLPRRLPLFDLDARTWSAPVPTRSWAAVFCCGIPECRRQKFIRAFQQFRLHGNYWKVRIHTVNFRYVRARPQPDAGTPAWPPCLPAYVRWARRGPPPPRWPDPVEWPPGTADYAVWPTLRRRLF